MEYFKARKRLVCSSPKRVVWHALADPSELNLHNEFTLSAAMRGQTDQKYCSITLDQSAILFHLEITFAILLQIRNLFRNLKIFNGMFEDW